MIPSECVMDINDRILDKLDKIDQAQQETKIEIVQIKGDLKEHMSRTLAVEETNDLLQKNLEVSKVESDRRLQRLEKWYDKFHYLGWALFAILGVLQKLEQLKAFLHSFF